MSKTRVSIEGIEKREAEINAYEVAIKRLETLKEAQKSEAMQIILECVERGSTFAKNRLVELAGYGVNSSQDKVTMDQLGGEIKGYSAILNDLRDPQKEIDRAYGEIQKRKNLIKTVKANEGLLVE